MLHFGATYKKAQNRIQLKTNDLIMLILFTFVLRILQSYPLDPVLKRFPFPFLSNTKRPLEFRKGRSARTPFS